MEYLYMRKYYYVGTYYFNKYRVTLTQMFIHLCDQVLNDIPRLYNNLLLKPK